MNREQFSENLELTKFITTDDAGLGMRPASVVGEAA